MKNFCIGGSSNYWHRMSAATSKELDEDQVAVKSKMIATTDDLGHKLWQCADCRYCVKASTQLVRHIQSNHIKIEMVCSICNNIYSSRPSFYMHMRNKHNITKRDNPEMF